MPRRPRVDGDVDYVRRVRRMRCGLPVRHCRVAEAVLGCVVVDDRCV